MSRNEDEYDEDDYKEWQDRYDDLKEEWNGDWSKEEQLDHLENMRLSNEQELMGRERAREEWGDDADDGHDERIEKLRGQDQLLKHDIAHAEGEYEYQTERMQDMDEDLRRELERENDERWRENEHEEEAGFDQREDEGEDMDIDYDSD